MRHCILLLAASVAAFSQNRISPSTPLQPLVELREFLQITDSQYTALMQNMNDYQRHVSDRQSRMSTLQSEIAEETARESPNPAELGTRYAELEYIRRAIVDESKLLQQRNVALLTDPQKSRLKILEDAWKLSPAIYQAQLILLMERPPNVTFAFGLLRPSDPAVTLP